MKRSIEFEIPGVGSVQGTVQSRRCLPDALPVLLGLMLAACGGDPAAGSGSKADKAATIAKEVNASPDDAEAILKKHGMTEEEFEALMFEIADDPKLAEDYAAKVGG
jgi:hypothetical protein